MSPEVTAIIVGLISLAMCNETAMKSKWTNNKFAVNFYEEIGCAKIPNAEPIAYKCPEFESLDPSKCYLKGESYENFETVTYDVIPRCALNCSCRQNGDEPANFECPSFECYPEPLADGCFPKYSNLNECCPSDQICGDGGACYLDGEAYREGQLMYSDSEPCYECLCSKDFDNSTEITHNSGCMKIECTPQLYYSDYIQQGCAPIYVNGCCPIAIWKCPTGVETVIVSDSYPMPGAPKCKFGDLSMNVGDRFETAETENLTCECVVPPIPMCTLQDRNKSK